MKAKRLHRLATGNLPATIIFAATAAAACAADRNWTGSTSTNWADLSNWAEGAVPVVGDNAWISNTATNIPSVTTTEAVTDLHIAEGAYTSVLNIDSGGYLSANFVEIGNGNNNTTASNGTLNVNAGGLLYSETDIRMSYAGSSAAQATLNIDGGTVHVASTIERWVIMGNWDPGNSEMNITNGGTLQLFAGTDIKVATNNNQSGDHTITVDGAGSRILGEPGQNSHIELGREGSGNYELNVSNGGLVETSAIWSNDGAAASSVVNIDGGTLRALNDDANFVRLNSGGTNEFNVLAGGATIQTSGFDLTIGNPVLEGATTGGGLTVNGGGSLTLEGASTYTGPTNIEGAELVINPGVTIDNTSGVTVSGGGKLTLLSTLPAGPLVIISSGTLDGDGTIGGSVSVANNPSNTISAGNGGVGNLTIDDFLSFNLAATIDLQATGDTMDQTIIVNGALATPTFGVGQLKINATNTQPLWTGSSSGVDYTIIDYSGGTFSGAVNDFSVGTLDPPLIGGQSASIVNTGSEIVLRITGSLTSWTALTDNNLDDDTVNFNDGSSDVAFTTGGIAVFGDGSANPSVNVVESFLPGAVLFNNFIDDYDFSGSFGIDGATSVSVTDGGLVTFANVNGYTGPTSIADGMIVLSGTGSISSSSSIDLGDDGTLVFEPTGSVTYANPITGSGTDNSYVSAEAAVTMRGTGTLTLSGANTFTGDFALDSGQLNLNNAGALGAGPGVITINGGTLDNTSGGTINMAPDKEVEWNGDFSFIGSNDLFLSNGVVTPDANRQVEVQAGVFGMGSVEDGGAGFDVTKTGAGTLVLNGCDIDGNLDVQNGIVGINQDLNAAAITGSGTFQNAGNVGTKWVRLDGNAGVSSNVLIRNNDTSHIFQIGIVKQGAGKLTLTNPSNNATANLSVESGTLELSGAGTYGARNDDGSTNGGLVAGIGTAAAADGVLIVSGATLDYNNGGDNPWNSTLDVGSNATGAGALRMSGGSLTTHRQLAIGRNGGFGGMTQTSGSTSVGGFLAMGLDGSQAVLTIGGGTFTVDASTGGPATIGAGAGSAAVVNLTGTGIYNHNSPADNAIWIGENGTGVMTIWDSAQLNVPNNGIELGKIDAAGSSGMLNLLGGTVTTRGISKPGASATGVLNFNGGTLVGNTDGVTLVSGGMSRYVYPGGGTIDNGGNDVYVAGLLGAGDSGVSSAGLSVNGSGFIETPVVTITGGGGVEATAVAVIDNFGNLIGITMTNPGRSYTSAPTFSLSGGGVGATSSIAGTATLVPVTGGGITYTGSGTTTILGYCTYTGDTTIDSGTTVTVNNGYALSVKPTANGVSSKITGGGTLNFDGRLQILLADADETHGNEWTVVDVSSVAYDVSTFDVRAESWVFTPQGDGVTHQLVLGDNTWTFSETTGKLTLVVAGSGFEGWISGFTVADDTPSGNSDADTLPNVGEYYHNNDPEVPEGSAVAVSESGGNLILTFDRSDLAQSNGDVTAYVEFGNDLVGWTRVAVPATTSVVGGVSFTITGGTPTDQVIASIPITDPVFVGRLVYVK